ncbi:MBL fold metallo-hydrolase [Myceligenerans pegani]|nr:hypothetical protein [Myceligenerans sp. TRM 65318]
MMLSEIADGVHRLEHVNVNVDVVEQAARGGHGSAGHLAGARRGLAPARAQVVGRCRGGADARPLRPHRRGRHDAGAPRVPIWLHEEDFTIAADPYRYAHENARAIYPLRYPRSLQVLASMTAAGALRVHGVEGLRPLQPGEEIPVSGRPQVIFTPGHTFGHCALHLRSSERVREARTDPSGGP